MNILLFGASGQIGWELRRSLAPLGNLTIVNNKHQHLCGDFKNPQGIAKTLRIISPDIIVNAAAYTAVDQAETEPEQARMINALTPGVIAREAKNLGALFIHYSTDYVFDGGGEKPWLESDPTGPLNIYGKTKLEGEDLIRASSCRHIILRTSWVYAARGRNFAKTILKLAKEKDVLNIIDDQTGSPTGAELIADISSHAIAAAWQRHDINGLYHLTANGHTTWHGYACFVIEFARQAGLDIKVAPDRILPVPTCQFYTPAKRPTNSRLNTSKLQNTFGLHLPDWQTGVTRMLTETIEKET